MSARGRLPVEAQACATVDDLCAGAELEAGMSVYIVPTAADRDELRRADYLVAAVDDDDLPGWAEYAHGGRWPIVLVGTASRLEPWFRSLLPDADMRVLLLPTGARTVVALLGELEPDLAGEVWLAWAVHKAHAIEDGGRRQLKRTRPVRMRLRKGRRHD